ncbi:MAG: sigma-70 family RNA polymerase sigma factor [Oscillospiraceae bacterium]|jgi:RNA polymerase sigma-70 factor (ECF subfamily)|nr:sigma-70 family RNA polymerase sigma factor [Oscillospiraceae bacterium]
MHSLLRTNKDIEEIYNRQMKMVYRICYGYMKNQHDTEDAVADTFCNLISSHIVFESDEHEKAWLIRACSNVCKNKLKHWSRTNENIDDHSDLQTEDSIDDTLKIVLELPDKYKTVVYMYYYEEYTSAEIAEILQKPKSTIRNYLSEARKVLKKKLGDLNE